MMDQLSLFDNRETTSPLASRIRPDTLDGFVGQKHLIGEGKVLRNLIEKDQVTSMIFWGPPGSWKNNPGQDYCRENTLLFHRFFRRDKRNKGNQNGNGAGGEKPKHGNPDHSFRGRDSPL